MKILQINTTVNSGSHGRIAEEIGLSLIAAGHESYIAAAYTVRPSRSQVIRIGCDFDRKLHGLKTRLFDRHGFGSGASTRKLVNQIKNIDPDIIHLHNIHGYYLHVGVLFNYLKATNKPVVWTFHDCWPFTGHCSYFDAVNCYKWKTECYRCPNKSGYPKSLLIDNSLINYRDKRQIFTGISNMVLVSPSQWLAGHLRESYLKDYEIRVINNGIDTKNFKPVRSDTLRERYKIKGRYILGVASTWTRRKGLDDFIRLRAMLEPEIGIVLVGLNRNQAGRLPEGIISISRTENIDELAALYSGAEVFVNPTYVDNFPTTNIEALACGTPVITYNTGGSPEALDENTGILVEKGDIRGLDKAVKTILKNEKEQYSDACRGRAVKLYNKNDKYKDYISLYQSLLDKNKA
jgi:glycosyltransferase involved in cell wall biosynthesis